VVRGRLPEDRHKVIPLSEALEGKLLEISKSELHLNTIGSRSFLDYRKVELYGRRSDYYNYFYQGATIVPQPCWFVDVVDASHPRFVVVKTARRAKVRGKVKDEIGPLPVEREFIYGVLTSAEVLPFCHLPPNIAVLPIKPTQTSYEIITRKRAKQLGYQHLAKWLEEAEKVWNKVRGKKKVDLYSWLDWQHKLTRQNPNIKYKVVYARSGQYIASCVIELQTVLQKYQILNGIIFNEMVDYYETDDRYEAHYLIAIFNSNVLNELIQSMIVKGEFGGRHIHKKVLELPIPRFDPNDPIHRRLAELGRLASERACKALPKLLAMLGYDRKLRERGTLLPIEVARLRQAIRDELKDIISGIDDLVSQILLKGIETVGKDMVRGSTKAGKSVSRTTVTLDKWLKPRGR
jgi:hypothetical protein